MIRIVAAFALTVFVVWYQPALSAIVNGTPGSVLVKALAGVVVAFPVALLATAGGAIGFWAAHNWRVVSWWFAAGAGVACGIMTRVWFYIPSDQPAPMPEEAILGFAIHPFLKLFLAGIVSAFAAALIARWSSRNAG